MWGQHDKPKGDNDYFERMSRIIFSAGLNWRMIDKKWPGIKRAFAGFDVAKVAKFQEMEIEELMNTPDVIHSLPKIRAIVANARQMKQVAEEHDSFANYLTGLRETGGEKGMISVLSKRFAFLGKGTSVLFLWAVGEDLPEAGQEWRARHQRMAHS